MDNSKYLLFFIVFQLMIFSMKAQVVITDRYFNVDASKQLILVNQPLEALNIMYPDAKTTIAGKGVNYTFDIPVLNLEKGIAYTVQDDQNNTYNLYFSELPIIKIQTNNTIVDEPRVHAQLSLCESNGSLLQHDIGIEYRGGSSQVLPKKSLRIEFWNDELGTEKENVALLGMRSDDDWNLEAFYREPLRLRSKLSFDFWRNMDNLYYQNEEPEAINGVHQAFVEVFLNGAYQGVYGLSERVDRKQLKLKKNTETEIRGGLYKGVDWGVSSFTSLPSFNNNDEFWDGIEHKYPTDIIEWSSLYGLANFIINENSDDFFENYQDQFKLDNAVNYFIFMNLLRAQDNTGKNIFIARYDQDEPYFYVPWDLNASLGLFWNGNLDNYTEGILTNGFYERLRNDTNPGGFLERLEERWTQLRNTIITTEAIVAPFYTQYNYLDSNGVYEREGMAWDEYEFGGEDDITYIEQWLIRRIEYLDGFFYNPNSLTKVDTLESDDFFLKLFPNPTFDRVQWEKPADFCSVEKVIVLNATGHFVQSIDILEGQNVLDLDINPGLYFLRFEFCDGKKILKKLVVK